MQYKIDFKKLNWEVPFEGIKHKYVDQENIRIRLVEYDRKMPPHWCEKPHYGYVLEGIFEIEFDEDAIPHFWTEDSVIAFAVKVHNKYIQQTSRADKETIKKAKKARRILI